MKLFFIILISVSFAEVKYLKNAHSHNDYYQSRPFYGAVNKGFASIEIDVFLYGGKLLVGHSYFELNKNKTLESMYLKPLRKRLLDSNGEVYGNGEELIFLVDIKTDKKKTLEKLEEVLIPYLEYISFTDSEGIHKRALRIIISGNRDTKRLLGNEIPFLSMDGRLSDLRDNKNVSSNQLPLISANWKKHFYWRGNGKIQRKDLEKLRDIVRKTHAQSRKLRFWNTPHIDKFWQLLIEEKIDLIGTDDLELLKKFLISR